VPVLYVPRAVAEPQPPITLAVTAVAEPPLYEDTRVVVFGFQPGGTVANVILQEFQQFGCITTYTMPPLSNCNWLYIHYETVEGARRALKANGQRLRSLTMMVGVSPLSIEDKHYLAHPGTSTPQGTGLHAAAPERQHTFPASTAAVRRPHYVLLVGDLTLIPSA
jgi:hypothetical protein